VQPKPPFGFENYPIKRRTYLLNGNFKSNTTPTPVNLHKQLKELFVEQEKRGKSFVYRFVFSWALKYK